MIGVSNSIENIKKNFNLSDHDNSKFFPSYGNLNNQFYLILTILAPYIIKNGPLVSNNIFALNINYNILFNIIESVISLNSKKMIPTFSKIIDNKKRMKRRKKLTYNIWNYICENLNDNFPNIMHIPMDIDNIENHYTYMYIDSFIEDYKYFINNLSK